MEDTRKQERWARSFRLVGQNSEDSVIIEEDTQLHDSAIFNTSCSFNSSQEERDASFYKKYPSFAKIEKACREFEEENNGDSLLSERPNFTSISSNMSHNTTDSTFYNSSIVAASDSGYNPDDSTSTSRTLQNIDSFLNTCIINSSCSILENDSLSLEESMSSTQTTYMELKEFLHDANAHKMEPIEEGRELNNYQKKCIENVKNLPEDVQNCLMTILEESGGTDASYTSVAAFKSLMMKAKEKTQSTRSGMATYSIHNSLSRGNVSHNSTASASVATPDGPFNSVRSLNNYNTSRVNVKAAKALMSSQSTKSVTFDDLDEDSFILNEKLCLGDEEIQKTPKPKLKLTEEEKKCLERCRQQELELASLSPYVSKSDLSKSCEKNGSYKSQSLDSVRGVTSSSTAVLSDWDIKKEVQQAERHHMADGESYAENFMKTIQKHFSDSDKSRSRNDFSVPSIEISSVSKIKEQKLENQSLKRDSEEFLKKIEKRYAEFEKSISSEDVHPINKVKGCKLSTTNSWMKSRKNAGPVKKISGKPIKKKSLIPKYKGSFSKFTAMSSSKASCLRDMISSSTSQSREKPSASNKVDSAPKAGLSSNLLSPGWTMKAEKPENQLDDLLIVPTIQITCCTPERDQNSQGLSRHDSSERKSAKFERRYFCTPGKTPVLKKKKRVFFPTPDFKGTPGVRANSPVAAYIRGELSASFIKSSDRVINKFLHTN